jgi:peptidoglycan hydrolase CwlO-like protein
MFRLLLNPTTTIVFALIGVTVGIVSIKRSSVEEASKTTTTYIEKLTELKATQAQLGSELQAIHLKVDSLESENKGLNTAIEAFGKRLAIVEGRVSTKVPTRNKAGKKTAKS